MRAVFAVAAVLALIGCDQPLPDEQAPALPISATCRVQGRDMQMGLSGDARQVLNLRNDGAWCGTGVTFASSTDRRPRGEKLRIDTAPANGEVDLVHMVRRSRVLYRPRPGYNGGDSFSVRGVESGILWRFDVLVAP